MKTFVVGISLSFSFETNTPQSLAITDSLKLRKPGKVKILLILIIDHSFTRKKLKYK
jgi:hypothetical protein